MAHVEDVPKKKKTLYSAVKAYLSFRRRNPKRLDDTADDASVRDKDASVRRHTAGAVAAKQPDAIKKEASLKKQKKGFLMREEYDMQQQAPTAQMHDGDFDDELDRAELEALVAAEVRLAGVEPGGGNGETGEGGG